MGEDLDEQLEKERLQREHYEKYYLEFRKKYQNTQSELDYLKHKQSKIRYALINLGKAFDGEPFPKYFDDLALTEVAYGEIQGLVANKNLLKKQEEDCRKRLANGDR